jgi:hypothetical protein
MHPCHLLPCTTQCTDASFPLTNPLQCNIDSRLNIFSHSLSQVSENKSTALEAYRYAVQHVRALVLLVKLTFQVLKQVAQLDVILRQVRSCMQTAEFSGAGVHLQAFVFSI